MGFLEEVYLGNTLQSRLTAAFRKKGLNLPIRHEPSICRIKGRE